MFAKFNKINLLIIPFFLFLLSGCGAKLPSEEQIMADLTGQKTGTSIMDSSRTIKNVNSLEILGTQDNVKTDNTVKFLVQAEWIEDKKFESPGNELIFSGELEITYEDFGKNLFKIQSISVDDTTVKLLPPSVPNEDELKTMLMTTELKLADNEDGVIYNGDVAENSSAYSLDLEKEESRDIALSDYIFNEAENKITFNMDAAVETEKFSFSATYTGIASYTTSTAPDWDVSITLVTQSISYNYPKTLEGDLDTGTLTKKLVGIDFIKDGSGKITSATVRIAYQPFLSMPDSGIYEATASVDPITGDIVLLAGDWIQKPENEIFEKFDIKVYFYYALQEYYIDPINYNIN